MRVAERARLDTELAQADKYAPSVQMLQGHWNGIVWPGDETAERDPSTGVANHVLEKVGRASVTVPSGFVRPFLRESSRSSVELTRNAGDPPEATAPCKKPAAGNREGRRLGLGHGRSEWLVHENDPTDDR